MGLPRGQEQIQQRHILFTWMFYQLIWGEAANMVYEVHGLLAGNVSIVTRENIKPSYGGEEESFPRKVITPIYREANKSKGAKASHSAWFNYDDLNSTFG